MHDLSHEAPIVSLKGRLKETAGGTEEFNMFRNVPDDRVFFFAFRK
jgi:hypothetical protein